MIILIHLLLAINVFNKVESSCESKRLSMIVIHTVTSTKEYKSAIIAK